MVSRSSLVVVALNTLSISSRVFPLVSGTRKTKQSVVVYERRMNRIALTDSQETENGESGEEEVGATVSQVGEHHWGYETDNTVG